MEIRTVIFLALAAVNIVTNTLLILFAYRAFAGLTSKWTKAVSQFENSSETRRWIDSLRIASEQAAAVTETTKRSLAEFDPTLGRAQESYKRTLADVDSRLDDLAYGIDTTVRRVRDVVAAPAFSMMAFAAGIAKVFEGLGND